MSDLFCEAEASCPETKNYGHLCDCAVNGYVEAEASCPETKIPGLMCDCAVNGYVEAEASCPETKIPGLPLDDDGGSSGDDSGADGGGEVGGDGGGEVGGDVGGEAGGEAAEDLRRLRPEPLRLTTPDGELDAYGVIKALSEVNLLCRRHGFRTVQVSDLEGFADCLEELQDARPLIAVSDTSAGAIDTLSPSTRRMKTVFLFMPHSLVDRPMERRADCFAVMREVMRQLLSVLVRQSARLRLCGVALDSTVTFEEIDRYFYSGGACAYFSIYTTRVTDLRLRAEEWSVDPLCQF